jgi:hypothetical protein
MSRFFVMNPGSLVKVDDGCKEIERKARRAGKRKVHVVRLPLTHKAWFVTQEMLTAL